MNRLSSDTPTIAVIGASTGQLPLVRKAKEMGVYTICFAWENGAVCKEECDEFYPISIFEIDDIVTKCKELKVDGVISTASEETSLVSSVIAQRLNLTGALPDAIKRIQNKKWVREMTRSIPGLSNPKVWTISQKHDISYPCVVKPVKGSSKKGVSFCRSEHNLREALEYASENVSEIVIEEYIGGQEYSVETLSYKGRHHVIQITRKVTTGYPHFVELEHHQPALLDENVRNSVIDVVKSILDTVGYTNGASHIELKINAGNIYLIEINPRAGGDRISDTLVGLSTDCDYLASMVDIALGRYVDKEVHNTSFSGILFLTAQNSRILKYFDDSHHDWLVERKRTNDKLTVSSSNYDRDGYIIYKSKKQLNL